MLGGTVESAQYLSIRYIERLAEAGIKSKVGSAGDSYDNALVETIKLFLQNRSGPSEGPWHNMQDMGMGTFGWVDWFNNRPLLGSIGIIPSAEAEVKFNAQRDVLDIVA